MKINNIFLIFCYIILTACQTGNRDNEEKTENASTNSSSPLTIDTFSEIPPEIAGCSCFYSTDTLEFKQLKYIYVSDFNELSYMKINGKLLQFRQTNINRKEDGTLEITATCNPYILFLTVKSIPGENAPEEEYSREAGVIIVKDDQGNSITKTLYGSCGC